MRKIISVTILFLFIFGLNIFCNTSNNLNACKKHKYIKVQQNKKYIQKTRIRCTAKPVIIRKHHVNKLPKSPFYNDRVKIIIRRKPPKIHTFKQF